MEQQTRKRRSLVVFLLSLAVLVAAVLATSRFFFDLDFSADGANSLAKVTKQLYKDIPEEVRLTYYVSKTLTDRDSRPQQIEQTLRKVAAASKGRISLQILDPADSKGQNVAELLGIQGQHMPIIQNNEQRVVTVYSGVAVQYLSRSQVIPFVIATDGLEYNLVKAIKAAVSGQSYVASILVGDGDKSWQNNYQSLAQTLQRSGWEAREVQRGEAVPADTSVLLVLGNSALDDYDVYRIDQFIASGGKVLFAVKGVDVQTQQGLYAQPLQQDSLLRALDSYGVKVDKELVLDKSMLTARFQVSSPTGGTAVNYVPYPHWIMTRPEFRDRKNPLTARTEGLDLFWPSPLELSAKPGVESSVLVKTTPKAWLQKDRFAIAPEEEQEYGAEASKTTGQYNLIVSLSGVLPSAFAGQPLPVRKGAAALPAPLPASKAAKILVIGSSDFASDIMTYTDSTFNASFVTTAADWLASGDDLVQLRTRGEHDTRLSKLQDPAARAEVISLSYIVNIVLIPVAVVVFGLVRASRRKKLARNEALEASASETQQTAGGKEGDK